MRTFAGCSIEDEHGDEFEEDEPIVLILLLVLRPRGEGRGFEHSSGYGSTLTALVEVPGGAAGLED